MNNNKSKRECKRERPCTGQVHAPIGKKEKSSVKQQMPQTTRHNVTRHRQPSSLVACSSARPYTSMPAVKAPRMLLPRPSALHNKPVIGKLEAGRQPGVRIGMPPQLMTDMGEISPGYPQVLRFVYCFL
jgi:hypothetical protein